MVCYHDNPLSTKAEPQHKPPSTYVCLSQIPASQVLLFHEAQSLHPPLYGHGHKGLGGTPTKTAVGLANGVVSVGERFHLGVCEVERELYVAGRLQGGVVFGDLKFDVNCFRS